MFTNDIYNVTKEIIQTNAFELSISQTFMKINVPTKYEAAKLFILIRDINNYYAILSSSGTML